MRSPVRARLRPRPVEHFDGNPMPTVRDKDTLLLALCALNVTLQRDIAAWRLRYYASQVSPTQPCWTPAIPQQRDAPPAEQITSRYQRLRLHRADL